VRIDGLELLVTAYAVELYMRPLGEGSDAPAPVVLEPSTSEDGHKKGTGSGGRSRRESFAPGQNRSRQSSFAKSRDQSFPVKGSFAAEGVKPSAFATAAAAAAAAAGEGDDGVTEGTKGGVEPGLAVTFYYHKVCPLVRRYL